MAGRRPGLDREIAHRRRVQLRQRIEAARAEVLAREEQRAAEVAEAERRKRLAREYADAFAPSPFGFQPWQSTNENGAAA